MAKSLRSKRMRRNRAAMAERTQPRVLKRMVDSLQKAEKFNKLREEEKQKQIEEKEGVEMTDVSEPPVTETVEKDEPADQAMNGTHNRTFDKKTGIMSDGSKPTWMNQKQFQKLQMRLKKGKKDKFGLVTEGLGP